MLDIVAPVNGKSAARIRMVQIASIKLIKPSERVG